MFLQSRSSKSILAWPRWLALAVAAVAEAAGEAVAVVVAVAVVAATLVPTPLPWVTVAGKGFVAVCLAGSHIACIAMYMLIPPWEPRRLLTAANQTCCMEQGRRVKDVPRQLRIEPAATEFARLYIGECSRDFQKFGSDCYQHRPICTLWAVVFCEIARKHLELHRIDCNERQVTGPFT